MVLRKRNNYPEKGQRSLDGAYSCPNSGTGRDGDVPYDEQPEWFQTLDAFYITQTEITNGEFATFLHESKLSPKKVIPIRYKGKIPTPTKSQCIPVSDLEQFSVERSFLLQR